MYELVLNLGIIKGHIYSHSSIFDIYNFIVHVDYTVYSNNPKGLFQIEEKNCHFTWFSGRGALCDGVITTANGCYWDDY